VVIPLATDYSRAIDHWSISNGSNINTFVKPYSPSQFPSARLLDSLLIFGKNKPREARGWLKRKWSYENFIAIDTGNFKMYIDPLFNLEVSHDFTNKSDYYINTRGIRLMGSIDNNLFFETQFYENQAIFPTYLTDYIISSTIVPGMASTGYGALRTYRGHTIDFGYVSGIIGFKLNKYFDFRVGQGKNFIGDGYRSLLLSDNSFNYPLIQATFGFKKLQYTRIMAVFLYDRLPENKFGARQKRLGSFNILTYMPFDWVHVSLFEGSVWNYPNSKKHITIDYNYFNPFIFANSAISQTQCRSVGGLGLKFNIVKHLQLYSQMAFYGHSIIYSKISFASQLGVKLFLNNFYCQTEFNYSPPEMYTSADSSFNYSNYNQALAHPLGTNFSELVIMSQYNYNNFKFCIEISGVKYGIHSNVLTISGPYKVTDIVYSTPFIGLGQETKALNIHSSVSYLLNPTSNRRVECGYNFRNANVDGSIKQSGYFYIAFKTDLSNGFWGF
jgi:hypothetical protein